jgi:uroporphyrinogen decarboxylase
VLFREGEPDRVPAFEVSIDTIHKTRFLGRKPASLEDEIEFWAGAGYDHVPVQAGIRSLLRPSSAQAGADESGGTLRESGMDVRKLFTARRERYAYDGGYSEREWAPEGDGVITSQGDFDSFPWPSPDSFTFEEFEIAEQALPEGLRVTAFLGWVFTGAWWLMGMEGFMFGLHDQPDLVRAVTRRIGEIQAEVLRRLLRERRGGLGAVLMSDDLAHGGGLLVGPDYLRSQVLPWYREMIGECHRAGLPVILHSDGDVTQVIPDIIEAGFDGFHPVENQAMDIRALKRDYGRQLTLFGNIDLAFPLALGKPEDVRRTVRDLIRDCAPGGGLGVGSGNSVPEYVPYENWLAMREATHEYGSYPIGA